MGFFCPIIDDPHILHRISGLTTLKSESTIIFVCEFLEMPAIEYADMISSGDDRSKKITIFLPLASQSQKNNYYFTKKYYRPANQKSLALANFFHKYHCIG